MTTIRIAGISDCGRMRAANQDHYLIGSVVAQSARWTVEFDAAELDAGGMLCAVADGLGGHRGGEVASRLVLESLAAAALGERDAEGVWLGRLLARAHERLIEIGVEQTQLRGLGTTIVGVHIRTDACTVFHAGDSRLYRCRDGFLNQLTEDHASDAADRRLDKSYQPRTNSTIFNCLGGEAHDRCVPAIRSDVVLLPGDQLLLCSDGLTDAIPDPAALEAVLGNAPDPASRIRALVAAANEAGGPDNITAIMVEVDEHDG